MSTRVCSRCRIEKPESEFGIKDADKGWRHSRCRDCIRAYSREHYLANRPAYLARARDSNVEAAERRRELIRELRSKPCTDCGHRFPTECMEFDHRSGRVVKGKASPEAIANIKTFKKLWAELEKCDLVCSNCHKIRTAARRKSG